MPSNLAARVEPGLCCHSDRGSPLNGRGVPPRSRKVERASYRLTDEARLTAEARWRAAPSIPPLCHKKAASRLVVTA